MSLDNLSKTDLTKLTEFMDAGVNVLQEIADLKEGLSDTAKNLAEDFGTTPSILKSAVTSAFKATLGKQKATLGDVETILVLTGRA